MYFVHVLYVKCNLIDIEKKNIMEWGVYLKGILSLGNTFLGNLKVTLKTKSSSYQFWHWNMVSHRVQS